MGGSDLVKQNEQLSGQRVMHTFDFEEKDKHFNKLPMYWWKVRGRENEGFAHYSMGRLDETHHRSGGYSFRLDSDGSSVGFMYARRQIQARSGSDFAVTAWVHLEQVRSSRARISCALTDRTGRIIQDSVRNSKLVSSQDHTDTGWAQLEVYVPGNFPDARYITIGVWLLQEEQWNEQARQSSAIFRRDVKAVGWFDDITIVQLPRVLLHTDKPGNVVDGDETASLRVEVEGVNSLNYQVRLVVRHASGELVRDEIWHLSGLEGSNKAHVIDLPELPAGLYRAELSILTSKRLIATRELVFCKLARLWGSASSSGRNFGILSLDERVGDWGEAVELTRLCNAKLLKIPVWRKNIGQGGSIFSEPNFDRKLIELQKQNIELVATFSEAPDFLAGMLEVDHRGVLDVLSQDASIWKPQVSVVLAQYARQIPYWQIGGDYLDQRQTWDPRIKPVVQSLHQEFNRFVSNPALVVPLNSMFHISAEQAGSDYVSLSIPADITPRQIPLYLREYQKNGFGHIWVTIEPMKSNFHNREHKLIDFSKRIA
ncbi:MAG: hypothetical protein IID32_05025, partial [Planctomycetes bacterium]|nr:hypothetical protein [Planctomycetota bacterium]